MNPALLREWFDKLAPRERGLVIAAAALAIFAVIGLAGLRPLFAARGQAYQQVQEQRILLADLDQVARRIGPQGPAAAGAGLANGQSLVVLVDRTTRERGLSSFLKRNQPEGQNSIRLRLENAPFDQLLEWLVDAQSRYGLAAVSASFDPAGEAGRVNCSLVLAQATR